ncbi:MAG: amidohydrolase family protein [Chloroflexota bacterium]
MIIDFHSHFFPENFLQALAKGETKVQFAKEANGRMHLASPGFQTEIGVGHYDLAERIATMDAAGVDMQCLTPTIPGVHKEETAVGIKLARLFNEGTAAAVAQHPQRFTGLAMLPLQDPAAAVAELDYAVTQLGLKGGALFTNINGRSLDDPAYLPLFAKAVELDVPLWLHPTVPHDIGWMADYRIVVVAGFLHETAVAVCRLIYSGVLEQFPTLKLILSQMGGPLPMLAERIERAYVLYPECQAQLSTSPTTLLKRLYLDTTPHTPEAIQFAVQFVGVDQVLMGSDYPQAIGDIPGAVETIKQLRLSDSDKYKIMGGNIYRLLKL